MYWVWKLVEFVARAIPKSRKTSLTRFHFTKNDTLVQVNVPGVETCPSL